MTNPESLTDEGRALRNSALDDAALAIDHLAKLAAHSAMSMRNRPCRDRRDEEDYERTAKAFDGKKDVLKSAADAVRHLKTS